MHFYMERDDDFAAVEETPAGHELTYTWPGSGRTWRNPATETFDTFEEAARAGIDALYPGLYPKDRPSPWQLLQSQVLSGA